MKGSPDFGVLRELGDLLMPLQQGQEDALQRQPQSQPREERGKIQGRVREGWNIPRRAKKCPGERQERP